MGKLENLVNSLLFSLFLGVSSGCVTYQTCSGEMLRRKNNIVSPTDFDLDGKITKANRALIRFPNEGQINEDIGIEVVKSVKKYLIAGARYLLIHARQAHFKKGLSEETIKTVRGVQTEIYLSSDYFRKNKNVKLKKVHDEGIDSEGWARILVGYFRHIDNIDRYRAEMLKEDIKSIEYKLSINPEDRLEALLEEKRRRLREVQEDNKRMITYGAILKLGAEGKIRVLPSKKRLRKYKGDPNLREKVYIKHDLEEDGVIEVVVMYGDYKIYFVGGGAHAFGGKDSCGKDYDLSGRLSLKDNIAEWNRENPKNKLSLIEITFMSYKEYKEEIETVKKAINHQD